jgi:hypothetical protein
MAIDATPILRLRELHAAAVFLVAGGAGRRRRLIRGVRRRVVAGESRGVPGSAGPLWHASHFFSAKACALDTGPALYVVRLPAAANTDTQSTAAIGSASDSRIRHRRMPCDRVK